MFWILAAFGALLMDRDDGRRRLAARLARRPRPPPTAGLPALQLVSGPWLGRPVVARRGRSLPRACRRHQVVRAVLHAAFGLLTVFWDLSARRIAGIRGWISGGIIKDGIPAFLSMCPWPEPCTCPRGPAGSSRRMRTTGTGLIRTRRPVGLDSRVPAFAGALPPGSVQLPSGAQFRPPVRGERVDLAGDGPPHVLLLCVPQRRQPRLRLANCTSAILSVGNPLIWWSATISLVILLFWWAGRRDWRAGAILAGVAAGYLPWFMYPERTMFYLLRRFPSNPSWCWLSSY